MAADRRAEARVASVSLGFRDTGVIGVLYGLGFRDTWVIGFL